MIKILLGVCIMLSSASLRADNIFSEMYQSMHFEPALLCATGSVVGGAASKSQSKNTTMLLGCAVGAAIGYYINDHYKDKFTSQSKKELERYRNIINERQKVQALKAAKGDDFDFAVTVREVVPAQRLPNGEVRAPTVKERLILLEDSMFIGE